MFKEDTMVSNTKEDCTICNDKFAKLAKLQYVKHKGEKFDNCLKCGQIYERINEEHFQSH